MPKRDYMMPGRSYVGLVRGFQGSLITAEGMSKQSTTQSGIARVAAVYSDRGVCDIESWCGPTVHNVPVLTKAGLISNQIYGVLDLPAVGDYVIVDFIGGQESRPVIVGTLIPYMDSKAGSAQVPVNSTSKAFTKKLLEAGKNNTYRRIFKSGATVEVDNSGNVIVEVPSGAYLKINTSAGRIELSGTTKDLVTHAELNTALQSFVTALNALFASKLDGGGTAGTLVLDITAAKALKLKTG